MSHMPGQHLHSGACFSLPREFFIGAPQAVFDDPPFQCFRILSHCLLEASQFAARVVSGIAKWTSPKYTTLLKPKGGC